MRSSRLLLGANPGGERPGRGLQEGRGEVGRLTDEPVKGRRGKFQHRAVHVGNHVRRTRAVIEQRHVAEEIAGAERGEDRFLSAGHRARAQLPVHDEIHRVAGFALLHHHRPLRHGLLFHELNQMSELRVAQPGQDFDAPQRAGLDADGREGRGAD